MSFFRPINRNAKMPKWWNLPSGGKRFATMAPCCQPNFFPLVWQEKRCTQKESSRLTWLSLEMCPLPSGIGKYVYDCLWMSGLKMSKTLGTKKHNLTSFQKSTLLQLCWLKRRHIANLTNISGYSTAAFGGLIDHIYLPSTDLPFLP